MKCLENKCSSGESKGQSNWGRCETGRKLQRYCCPGTTLPFQILKLNELTMSLVSGKEKASRAGRGGRARDSALVFWGQTLR